MSTVRRYAQSDLKVPGLTRETVEAIDRLFPERCPSFLDDDRRIWAYVGTRELVCFLKQQLEVNERVARDIGLSL